MKKVTIFPDEMYPAYVVETEDGLVENLKVQIPDWTPELIDDFVEVFNRDRHAIELTDEEYQLVESYWKLHKQYKEMCEAKYNEMLKKLKGE